MGCLGDGSSWRHLFSDFPSVPFFFEGVVAFSVAAAQQLGSVVSDVAQALMQNPSCLGLSPPKPSAGCGQLRRQAAWFGSLSRRGVAGQMGKPHLFREFANGIPCRFGLSAVQVSGMLRVAAYQQPAASICSAAFLPQAAKAWRR